MRLLLILLELFTGFPIFVFLPPLLLLILILLSDGILIFLKCAYTVGICDTL